MKRISLYIVWSAALLVGAGGCGVWEDIFGSNQKATTVPGIAMCDANGDGKDDRPSDLRQAVLKRYDINSP